MGVERREPLLFLHGFGGCGAAWGVVTEALAAPCLCPDLLGHEAAPAGPWASSFDEEVDRITALARDADLGQLHLVGYSLGARIGLGLLARHTHLFRAATLIGVHPGLESADERALRIAADEAWASLAEQAGTARFFADWEAQPLFATQAALAPQAHALQRRLREGLRPQGLAASLRTLGLGRMPSYWASLPQLGLPVRLVVGALDSKFEAIAERAAARLPRGRMSVVVGAGHNPVLEQPKAITALLEEER